MQHPQIGWHLVAARQEHDIAGHEIRRSDDFVLSIAPDARTRRQPPLDRGQSSLGPALLDEADDRARVDPLAQRRRDHGGDDKHVDQGVIELAGQTREGAPLPLARHFVAAVTLAPAGGLVTAKPSGVCRMRSKERLSVARVGHLPGGLFRVLWQKDTFVGVIGGSPPWLPGSP